MRAAIGCREAILADAKNFEAFDAREETTIRAFCLNKSSGFIFQKGIWHEVDCFPVNSESLVIFF